MIPCLVNDVHPGISELPSRINWRSMSKRKKIRAKKVERIHSNHDTTMNYIHYLDIFPNSTTRILRKMLFKTYLNKNLEKKILRKSQIISSSGIIFRFEKEYIS